MKTLSGYTSTQVSYVTFNNVLTKKTSIDYSVIALNQINVLWVKKQIKIIINNPLIITQRKMNFKHKFMMRQRTQSSYKNILQNF